MSEKKVRGENFEYYIDLAQVQERTNWNKRSVNDWSHVQMKLFL